MPAESINPSMANGHEGQPVNFYVRVQGKDILVLENIRNDTALELCSAARKQLKRKRRHLIGATWTKNIIFLCTPAAFPGIDAFVVIKSWLSANESVLRSAPLKPLLPPSHVSATIAGKVNIYAAARLLGIFECQELRFSIYNDLARDPSTLTAANIALLFDRLGDHRGITVRAAGAYYSHLRKGFIDRSNKETTHLFATNSAITKVFNTVKAHRDHCSIANRLEKGDIFVNDVPYLLL